MLNDAKNNQKLHDSIMKILDEKLTRNDERALFDLPPLPETENGKAETTQPKKTKSAEAD